MHLHPRMHAGSCGDGLVTITFTADDVPTPGQETPAPVTGCVEPPSFEPTTNQLVWSYCFRSYCAWPDVPALDFSVSLDWLRPEELAGSGLDLMRAGDLLLDCFAPPQVVVYTLFK